MNFINMADDSHVPTPPEMAARLGALSATAEPDYYGQGGAVEGFERQVAALLGKERAVMFPTGTMGNQIVLSRLCGGAPGRIVVHRHSHLFNDAGDNLSQLSGLTMVPLEGQGAGFTADQLGDEIARTASARVGARIGAVAIESPSRRLHGRQFGPQLDGVLDVARDAGIPLFLDGARMLIECAWTGRTPAEMAAPFDAVYLSLYKYLKAPFGCVLAGPAALFEDIHHERRRFGGSLYQMWPAALLAAEALPQQAATWARARQVGEAAIALMRDAGLPVTVFEDGTNVILVKCGASAAAVAAAAQKAEVKLLPPSGGQLSVKINDTWLDTPAAEIAGRLGQVMRDIAA